LVSKIEEIFSYVMGGDSVAFSSGMSAIWAVLWATAPEVESYITVGSFYRKTLSNIADICSLTGRHHINYPDLEALMSADLKGRPFILLESPANPFLRLVDVQAVRNTFPDATIMYDNTMAGLLNDRNYDTGADFVVCSCTKYIGGHNDVLGGIVSTPDPKKHLRLWEIRSSQGGILDPFAAFLIFRSLKTYDVRMARILENVEPVLEALESHNKVDSLYYPGRFANSDQADIASRCYYHGSGVITFEVSKDVDLTLSQLQLHSSKMAPSFGSTDTLIERPATMSHAGKTEEELSLLGLSLRHIRLSVGMEPISYILSDIDRLLSNG
jgi:cystathionine beta-lyase/cystathionine gamma-synthase